jgi:hypothetical protein
VFDLFLDNPLKYLTVSIVTASYFFSKSLAKKWKRSAQALSLASVFDSFALWSTIIDNV